MVGDAHLLIQQPYPREVRPDLERQAILQKTSKYCSISMHQPRSIGGAPGKVQLWKGLVGTEHTVRQNAQTDKR